MTFATLQPLQIVTFLIFLSLVIHKCCGESWTADTFHATSHNLGKDSLSVIWSPLDANQHLTSEISAPEQFVHAILPRSLIEEKQITDRYPVRGMIRLELEQSKKEDDFTAIERHERQRSIIQKRFDPDTVMPESYSKNKLAERTQAHHSAAIRGIQPRGTNSFPITAAAVPALQSTAAIDEVCRKCPHLSAQN